MGLRKYQQIVEKTTTCTACFGLVFHVIIALLQRQITLAGRMATLYSGLIGF